MCVFVLYVCMCVLGDGLWDKSFVKRGGGWWLLQLLWRLNWGWSLFLWSDGSEHVELWKANQPVVNQEQQFGFTQFALRLNEQDESE